MRLGDVVDELLDEHGLAHAGAAEQADLAALGVGRQQIHHLDAGDQDLRLGRLLRIGGSRLMNGAPLGVRHRTGVVDRLADDVDDAPERAVADRNGDRRAGVGDLLAAHQAFGDVHRDGAHRGFAEMLGHLEDQAVALVAGLQRVEDRRQLAVELDVDDGADDLSDAAGLRWKPCKSSSTEFSYRDNALQRLGAGDDLDQLLGDHRLAGAVVAEASACGSFRRRCGWRCPSRSSGRRRTRRCSRAARRKICTAMLRGRS